MKKSFYLLIFLVVFFIGIGNIQAYGYEYEIYVDGGTKIGPDEWDYNCVEDQYTKTCNLKIVVNGANVFPVNRIQIGYKLTGLTPDVDNSSAKTGWHLVEMKNDYVVFDSSSTTLTEGTHDVATLVFRKSGSVGCHLTYYGIDESFNPYICEVKYGKYYNDYGVEVGYNEYLSSCFSCVKKGVKDNNWHGANGAVVSEADYYRQCGPVPYCKITKDSNGNNVYFGINGTEVTEIEYGIQCEGKKICDVDENTGKYYGLDGNETNEVTYYRQCGATCKEITSVNPKVYFGKNGTEVSEIEYKKQCEKPVCESITIGSTNYYFDKLGQEVTQAEYKMSCFGCEVKDNKYYNKEGQEVSKYQYEISCSSLKCREIKNDEGKTVYYNKDGKETTEIIYLKQCAVHSCEILSDGTHYDMDGKEVTEDEYLKSCFKCRKENDKYYDENGKETTKENWDIMCTPHKCENFGDKYFNDKGVLVTKEEYDKKCTNPQTGSTDKKSISYIISGLLFAGAIILISVKYNKLRRV